MSGTATLNIPPSIGIDLGTTYSCVGVWKDGHVEIVANEQGNRTTPSIVAFTDTHRLIGEPAKAQMTTNPENTVFDAKRLIGRYYYDSTVQADLKHWPFNIIADESKKIKIEVHYKGQIRRFYPEEISSMVLGKMKKIAEDYLGEKVRDAVITVPAYFNDAQRQATKDAGTIAGLRVMRIINEPTAAAIAYGLDKTGEERRNVLIFDLGGGTFDVSLLAIENGVFEVLATNGDTHLGGEDFDNRLVEYCINEFKRRYHYDMSKVQTSIRRLRSACERAKRLLSVEPQYSILRVFLEDRAYIDIDSLYHGIDFSITISRAKFEELNNSLFYECIRPVRSVLHDGKVPIDGVHDVVLVGGSTRIPKVQQILREFFHNKELCNSLNQDEAVAYGATVQASILSGYKMDSKTSLLLLDVVPLSLGVETSGGNMDIIIPKNSTVPIRKTCPFTTYIDNQEQVEIQVYEGEKTKTRNNNKLASFVLKNIPPAPKGVPRIEVTFDIDSNGILKVTATESSSGQKADIEVVNNKNHLTDDMINRIIDENVEFDEMDSIALAKKSAKEELNNYLHHVSQQLKLDVITNTLSEDQLDDIFNKLDEFVDWIEDNMDATIEQYKNKQLEFEYFVEPIIAPCLIQSFPHKDPIKTEEQVLMENIDE